MTDPTPHLFWITSRAAGTAALLLSSFGVSIGLLMGGRLVRRRGLDLRSTHEAVSLATLVAIAVHGLVLLGDGFLHPSVADISIPFVSSYKTGWTATGIVAGWGLALLGLSYYARRWIGPRRWRSLHRFTVLAWALGVIHSLGEGTDSGQRWFLVMVAIAVVPPVVLFIARVTGPLTGLTLQATSHKAAPRAERANAPGAPTQEIHRFLSHH
jgi:sulfoxide reductase heme-binding subunit YedZ